MEQFAISHLVAGLALALTFGGMSFFSLVMAPLVFVKLPPETAGAFIRQLFPWYYLTMGATTLIALGALVVNSGAQLTWVGSLMALVLIGFAFARQVLMPRINQARDAELAGTANAGQHFQQLHRTSVLINAVQWLAVTAVLVEVLV